MSPTGNTIKALLIAALLTAPAFNATKAVAAENGGEITCGYPVRTDDTAKSLTSVFGKDAAIENIQSEDEAPLKIVALYGSDPRRRIEVLFSDDKMAQIAAIQISSQPESWSIAGLHTGSGIKAVEEANGGPFEISGFSGNSGGYVYDFKGGKLKDTLKGGCTLSVRFQPQAKVDIPKKFQDGAIISSDDPDLAPLNLSISLLALLPADN